MTEKQPYDVVRDYFDFQLRRYPEHLLAEVTLQGSFEDAGTRAFRYLFAYISGANRSRSKVAMTAPVVQAEGSTTIPMTAPVVQQVSPDHPVKTGSDAYHVAFVLPAGLTVETAPQPTDPSVRLRTVPEQLVAAIRFRGGWSETNYTRHLDRLTSALLAAGLTPGGAPRFARFDPPFVPAFLRHNEIMLDLE